MINKRGQTWIEFLIATVAFLGAISILFVTVGGQFREESDKVTFQSNCIKASSLENFFLQPGEPEDWETDSPDIFGLSNGTPGVVSNAKWLKAKELGFPSIINVSTPSTSWKLGYSISAFETITDASCTTKNAVSICRSSGLLNVTANSTQTTRTSLVLFFPSSTAAIDASDADSNTTTTGLNGTEVSIFMITNSSDNTDRVNITFTSSPDIIFIKQSSISSGQNITLMLGNKTAQDSFGALTIKPRGLCSAKTRAAIAFDDEVAIADFNLQAW